MFKSSKDKCGKDQDEYTCTLTPEVLQKAVQELKEDPKTRLLEVKNLRSRLEKCPGLQARTDTKLLLRFLRARKFDQERTFQLVKSFYNIRVEHADAFNDLKPSRVRHVFESGMLEILKNRDNFGCKVLIFRPDNWDTDRCPLIDVLKCFYIVLIKMLEDEETQVCGVHIISQLTQLTFKQVATVTPGLAKFFVNTIQDVIPMRLKRYDVVNEPAVFDICYALIKPFLKEKLLSRFILNGDKYDKILHTTINPDFLPTDLGGKLPPHSNKEIIDELVTSDAMFEEDNKFGFVKMNVSSGDFVSRSGDAGMQGLGGTFKKLEI